MQEFTTRECGTGAQARTAALFGVNVFGGDGDGFIHRQIGFANHQSGHELCDGRNGQNCIVVFAQQHFLRILVNHVCHAGFQGQLVIALMQTCDLPE